jgi:probable phosphoglycerate mutase
VDESPDLLMRLVLIRHGESIHAGTGIISGEQSCRGLTGRGIRQAQRLTGRLRASGEVAECTALLSSPVPRARQTAEIVAGALPGRAVEIERGLLELVPGEADGLPGETYRNRYGAFDLLAEPGRPFSPGGESWRDFIARIEAFHLRLAERYAGQMVVAVTHAGFIVASFLTRFAIPRPGTGARVDPDFTGLTEWQVQEGAWRLVRFNDVNHERIEQ